MMATRSAQVLADGTPGTLHGADSLQEQAAQLFAAELEAGRVPSVRAIRAELHVGQPRAQRLRTTSLRELQGGRKVRQREQLAGRASSQSPRLEGNGSAQVAADLAPLGRLVFRLRAAPDRMFCRRGESSRAGSARARITGLQAVR